MAKKTPPKPVKVERKGGSEVGARNGARSRKPGAGPGARRSEPRAAPVLLAGGNPQIAKADGDAPVQAYIAAMPGWKRDVGRRLDALIVRTLPDARKAVKWNSPFYGLGGRGWFLTFHVFTRYVKVTFFRGSSLRPLPPVASKDPEARSLHIHEGDWGGQLDEDVLAGWVRQAAAIPGWDPGEKAARKRAPEKRVAGAKGARAGVEEPGDWRRETLSRIRRLIEQADPEAVEEVKWRKPSNSMAGVPVWSHSGIICTGETYKDKVKLTFAKGAALDDPAGLFNSSLEGNTRRAIDIRQGDKVDERAFKALIRAAVGLNTSS